MLKVKGLHKNFVTAQGILKAVNGVDLEIANNKTLGLVGESGSGKSTLGKSIIGLHAKSSGEVYWQNELMPQRFSRSEYLRYSKDIQMIFQDPYSALNPKMQVRQIVEEPLLLSKNQTYLKLSSKERKLFIQAQLERVGLRPEFYKRFPHEFSGGQQQRIGIARALVQEPKLLICDEPISALDVSVQAQVVNLLKKIQQENDLAILFIAHDLAMVNYLCDEVAVMYLGKIVEQGSREDIFFDAKHPYTQLLLRSNPLVNSKKLEAKGSENEFKGEIPSPLNLPPGCVFASRCPQVQKACNESSPQLKQGEAGSRKVACFLVD